MPCRDPDPSTCNDNSRERLLVEKIMIWYEYLRQGKLRVVWPNSGFHVVGEGHRVLVTSEKEGRDFIIQLKSKTQPLNTSSGG